MPHVLDQLHEPLTVARGLHTDQQRRRQLLIKPLGLAASMHQLLLPRLSRLCVQPTHLLPAGMEITSLYLVCISPIRWLCVSGELDRVSTGGRSHPCILFASPRFGGSVLVGNWIGFRREAGRILRRISSAAWIIDRPPALLSHAVENPRPFEPAFTRSAREMVQGRGAGTQSNPNRGGRTW